MYETFKVAAHSDVSAFRVSVSGWCLIRLLFFLADIKLGGKRRQPFVPYALHNQTGCTMWFATLTTTPTRWVAFTLSLKQVEILLFQELCHILSVKRL